METYPITIIGNEEKVCKRLQKLVRAGKFDDLGKVLNKIHVPGGFRLALHILDYDEVNGLGAESYPVIITPSGEEIPSSDKAFWKLLRVENTPLGAWQVYLLYNLWHYLPMFWHANYEKRTYVYSSELLRKAAKHFPEFGDEPLKNFNPDKYEIYPNIWCEGDIYHVGAHYWSDFEGLVYEELKIKLEGGVRVYLRPACHKKLYRYDCGICF